MTTASGTSETQPSSRGSSWWVDRYQQTKWSALVLSLSNTSHFFLCFHSHRGSWTPCKLSSTRWPFTAGRASTWTSACRGGGSWPGTPFLPQCPTQEATIPWWEALCSTRVTSRKPRRTWWATGSTTPTASASSQKVIGRSVALTAHLCIRAGEAPSHGVSWCRAPCLMCFSFGWHHYSIHWGKLLYSCDCIGLSCRALEILSRKKKVWWSNTCTSHRKSRISFDK